MRAYFSAPYDSELSHSMYIAYEEGDESIIEDLLASLCPLIGRTVRRVITTDKGNQDEVEADALSEVYRIVIEKTLPYHHHLVYTKFLRTSIRRSIANSFTRLSPSVFEFWRVSDTPYPDGNFELALAHGRIYRSQVAKAIQSEVRAKIRFLNNEKEACYFILDCVVGIVDSDPRVGVKRRFSIHGRRCDYLIRYIEILARSISWDILEDERESGIITSEWASGGSFLCTFS